VIGWTQEGRKKGEKMPKEPICDCGKPISQCTCEGHNHKKQKNVKKGGVPDYLSIFGDRVQQYADYKRKQQEKYTPRSLYAPFGMVVDIGDDGGLSGEARFYTPKGSVGSSMTKRVAKCPDCGKPEQLCRCEGHASMHGRGHSKMSKAMCKCGSGMTKAMCKCGGMGKRMSKGLRPFPIPDPSPIGDLPLKGKGNIYGTVMSFAGQLPGKMKDMLGLGDIYDMFKDSPMKLSGRRIGKRGNVAKLRDPMPPIRPDYGRRRPPEVSEFEWNGGNVNPQRELPTNWASYLNPFYGIYNAVYGNPFGYEAIEGYNPAENAVRQMTATPDNIAQFNTRRREKEFADAFSELMGAYGNNVDATLGNNDWKTREYNRADRATKDIRTDAKNAANEMYNETFVYDKNRRRMPGQETFPMYGTTNKRLSKSMKMDADMAKTPQKITPKRSVRHTDKYFK